jgi:putative nucleotidyltransferase with HDIG domain
MVVDLFRSADLLHVPLKKIRVRLGDAIELGSHRIPINESGEMVINYYGPCPSMPHLSFVDVVQGRYNDLPDTFRDKAVILGNTLSGGFDIQVTPFGGQYPGVEAQATVLQNILDGSGIRRLPAWYSLVLILTGALLVGAARPRPLVQQLITALLAILAIMIAGYWLLSARFLWMETVRPILAIVLSFAGVSISTFLDEQTARARAQGAVDALAEVTRTIAHTRDAEEWLPALAGGVGRVLGAQNVAFHISDEWLRAQLLLPVDAPSDAAASLGTRVPLVIRGKRVGHLTLRTNAVDTPPGLTDAAAAFAALSLENAALFGESRAHFLNLTTMLAEIIESKDRYTAGHCTRVMQHACAIAARIGLSAEEMDDLRYGALLHDIGKVGVRESVLNKPGALSPEEWEEMRQHPALGQQWLQREKRLHRISLLIASHHERWDGRGYPNGLAGEQIPLGGRILAVADVWDALTTNRPYREAMNAADAKRIIALGRGTQFDPRLVDVFLSYLAGGED